MSSILQEGKLKSKKVMVWTLAAAAAAGSVDTQPA